MFFIVNILFVAAAVLLVLVVAATSSLPARQEAMGDDGPEGEWMGPSRLSVPARRAPVVKRPAHARHVAAAGLQ